MNSWGHCKNLLCIRADNMGDLIMSTPAFRALKETFGCRITLLTSKAGSLITNHLEDVDEVIIQDLPWIKCSTQDSDSILTLIETIRNKKFDAAIIFTVYSQSALPAALLAFMADIPKRLAYSRENPYELLTDWIPDREPYETILHQVERDLALVAHVGAIPSDDLLKIRYERDSLVLAHYKLSGLGIETDQSWIVLHPGVSEKKREYPISYWIRIGQILSEKYQLPILITGSESEKNLTKTIAFGIGKYAFSVAGILSVQEFIAVIEKAKCVVSVNTSTIHIAAATKSPLVVLYAQTNPQHTPWKSRHILLPFSVDESLKSNNAIVRYVSNLFYKDFVPYPSPHEVVIAFDKLITTETVKVTEEEPVALNQQ